RRPVGKVTDEFSRVPLKRPVPDREPDDPRAVENVFGRGVHSAPSGIGEIPEIESVGSVDLDGVSRLGESPDHGSTEGFGAADAGEVAVREPSDAHGSALPRRARRREQRVRKRISMTSIVGLRRSGSARKSGFASTPRDSGGATGSAAI